MSAENNTDTISRAEHMKWCKERARAELRRPNGRTNAVASMCSDLSKHPETQPIQQMAFMMAMFLKTDAEVLKWIDGFAE